MSQIKFQKFENQFDDGTDDERYSKDAQHPRSKSKSNDEKLDHRIDQLVQISLFLNLYSSVQLLQPEIELWLNQ